MPTTAARIALCLASSFATYAQAQVAFLPPGGPSISVVSDGKTAISTSVNVTLQSSSDAALVFQSYGLHGPGVDPGPASLTSAATVTLKAKDYVTVPISVSGLTKFGTYRGSVEFRKAAEAPGGGTTVPITILVKGTVVIPPPALTAFRCLFPGSCALGNFLAPVNESILINNLDGQVDAQINYMTIMQIGRASCRERG